MAGLFDALAIGTRSLLAAQLAQATVGNNAANAATPGYSRRRPSIVESPPTIIGGFPVGTGAQVAGLQRMREALLDSQFRMDSASLADAETRAALLDQIGAVLSPADGASLATALDAFWAAWGDVSARPEDGAVRSVLLARAQNLVDAFHTTREKVDSLGRDLAGSLGDRAAEVNDITARLATINREIGRRSGDASLADERDRLVDRLSALIGARATPAGPDGTVQVILAGTGIQLVDGGRAATLAVTGDAASGPLTITVDGTAVSSPGGEMGGLLRIRNSGADGVPYAVGALDDLAGGVVAAVNRLHATGAPLQLPGSVTASTVVADVSAPLASAGLPVTPTAGSLSIGLFDSTGALLTTANGAIDPAVMSLTGLAAALDALPGISASVTGGRLTVSSTDPSARLAFGDDGSDTLTALGLNGFFEGSDARSIAVSSAVAGNPSRVGAGQVDLGAIATSPGDGRTAAALAALGQGRFLAGGTQTPAEALGALGAGVGAAARDARARADTYETVVAAVDAQRQSVSGVNLDEELADMVRYQHAYEASARFVRTVDEMIQTLLDVV
jgi:flagellar hook-associated protein 1 FlgK